MENIKNKCIEIYRQAFGKDELFEQRLFGKCFKHCRYLEVNGTVVAMLFALPCLIISQNRSYESIYIFAAATEKEQRGKGYMSRLLEQVKTNPDTVYFLRPANKELIGFYKKLGFKEFSAINSDKVSPLVAALEDMEFLAGDYISPDGKGFTLMYSYKENLNLQNLGFIYSME